MKLAQMTLDVTRNAVRIAAFALSLTLFFAANAFGQSPEAVKPEATTSTTPSVLFQDSALTSSDNVVNATRVPTVDSTGKIHYWDVTLLFDTDSSGDLTLAAGYPKVTASANPNSAHFKAGTYVGPSNINDGKMMITVSGPSVLPNGGTVWTLSTSPGANVNTYPDTAEWYVESIASNPLASRIKGAGITSTQLSYGEGDGWECSNSLLGFNQVGNTLTISSFSGCGDGNTPWDTIVYTLKP